MVELLREFRINLVERQYEQGVLEIQNEIPPGTHRSI
jgi:hypothetical protein